MAVRGREACWLLAAAAQPAAQKNAQGARERDGRTPFQSRPHLLALVSHHPRCHVCLRETNQKRALCGGAARYCDSVADRTSAV